PMGPSTPYVWSNNVFIGPWDTRFATSDECTTTGSGPVHCVTPISTRPIAGQLAYLAGVDLGCGGTPGNCISLRDTGSPSTPGNVFYSARAEARVHNWPSPGSPIRDAPPRPDLGGTTAVGGPSPSSMFPVPTACTDPIGRVAVPN